MIKNYIKLLLLCFGVLWVVNSCTDNEETQTPFSEIQSFENTFSLKDFEDDFIRENLIIHWEDFNLQQDQENNSSIYEFDTSLKVKNTLQNGKNTLAVTYKLIAFQDDGGNLTFELLKFLSTESTLNNISYFKPAGFSGTLYHYNLKGENTTIKAYKDGVLINEFTDEKTGIINAQSKAPEVGGCEEGCYVLVFTDHYTDYYLSINGSPFSYAYSVFKGTTSEWVWVSGSGGGGYDNFGSSSYHHHFDDPHGPNIGSNNHPDEHIIIDLEFSQNYPCQANIVQQAYGVCSPLTELILDIFEANDGTNLVYKSADDATMQGNGSPVNAKTTQTVIYNANTHTCDVTIKIRESYLETATDLSIARTAIHESLHATLVYMLEEGLLTLPDGTADPDFADLVNAHLDYVSGLPVNLNKEHHELMASFVSDIATALSAFGEQNGYNLPFSYYEAMSWQGLHTTADFNILYPEYINGNLNPERVNIINTLASEQDNQNYPDGNGGTISPQGNPCN